MFIADAYSKLWQRHASNALLYGTGSLGGRLEIGECIKVERTEREVYYAWRVRPKLVSDRGPRPERERERRPWSRRGGARCALLCTRGHLRRRAGSMRDSTPFRRCSHVANTLHGRRAHRRRRHRPQAALAGRERPHCVSARGAHPVSRSTRLCWPSSVGVCV